MINIKNINYSVLETLIKKVNPIIDNASVVIANEFLKISKPYTPYLSGDLERSAKLVRKGNRVESIVYDVPYAKKIYYGDENWNYTKTINRQAGHRWVSRAWNIHGKDIINNINRGLNRV